MGGMADPAPVAQTFFVDEEVQAKYVLDGIITVVDAKHIVQHLDEKKPEGAENESVEQLGFADRILLNKCDLVPDQQELQKIEDRVRAINSHAQLVRCEHSKIDVKNFILNIQGFNIDRVLEMEPDFLKSRSAFAFVSRAGAHFCGRPGRSEGFFFLAPRGSG